MSALPVMIRMISLEDIIQTIAVSPDVLVIG